MKRLNAQRAAARVASRELRRRPWRTVLVILLVAFPVGAMVMASSLVRTGHPPFDIEDRGRFGRADAIVSLPPPQIEGSVDPSFTTSPFRKFSSSGSFTQADLTADLQRAFPGTRVVSVSEADGLLKGPVGKARYVQVIEARADPIVAERLSITKGRLPVASDEVALSPKLASKWGLHVGDDLTIDRLVIKARIVGLAHSLADRQAELLAFSVLPDIASDQRRTELYVDLPGERADAKQLRSLRGLLDTRQAAFELSTRNQPHSADAATNTTVRWSIVVGALALAVVGIVIAAAFAVGARRQLRTLGILASNGASPPVVRAVVLWQGAWSGIVGAVLGFGFGAVGLALAVPHRDRFLSYDAKGWIVRPSDLVPIFALGVVAAVAASVQPARSVSRLSILTSLAGRRPLAPVPRRIVVLGVVAMAAGLGFLALSTLGAQGGGGAVGGGGGGGNPNVWAAVAVLGGLGLLFGSSAFAPALVGRLDPLARRARGSAHLAMRSLGRQRARTGAVVAAVCAAAALAVGGSAALASTRAPEDPVIPSDLVVLNYRTNPVPPVTEFDADGNFVGDPILLQPRALPVPDAEVKAVMAIVPGAKRIMISRIAESAYLATPEFLDAFHVDRVTRHLLESEGVVRIGPGQAASPFLFGPAISVPRAPGSAGEAPGGVQDEANRLLTLAVNTPKSAFGYLNFSILVSPAKLAELGLAPDVPGVASVGLVAPRHLTQPQRQAINDLVQARQYDGSLRRSADPVPISSGPQLDIAYPQPTSNVSPLLLYAVLDGLALLFTGFVVVVGLALAAAETRDEREVLTAVGASPATLRRLAASKAGLLALMGAALAVPTGLLPVWVVRNASSGSSRFVIPWESLILLLVLIPAVLAGLALVGSSIGTRFRPVTASSMTD